MKPGHVEFLDADGLPKPLVLCSLILLFGAFFVAWPGVDLTVAGALWDGHRFFMKNHWLGDFFDQTLMKLLMGGFGLWCLSWLVSEIRGRFVFGLTRRKYVFSIFSILLSAGVVTNLLFKDHWGRARPGHLVMFGGTKLFSPAFVIADQCDKNCSFFSGDASFAFSMLAIVLVLPKAWQKPLMTGVLMFGTIVGAMRMLYGAHFLSDIIFAALFTILIIQGMKLWLLRTEANS